MAVLWTDDLNAEFIRMRVARTPVSEMAEHFGTSVAAIYAHARVINCLVMKRKSWSDEDNDVVRRMVASGSSDQEIADALDREPSSVRWKIDDLGLTGVRVRFWSDQEAQALRGLAGSGWTALRISLELRRSIEQVRHKARSMGVRLPRPKRDMTLQSEARRRKKENTLPKALTESQLKTVRDMTGTTSQREIAATLGMSLKVMIARADAAGYTVEPSVRRHGRPMTFEVLAGMIEGGLTAREAGAQLARDPRTVVAAANAFGLCFTTRAARRVAARDDIREVAREKAEQNRKAKAAKPRARQKAGISATVPVPKVPAKSHKGSATRLLSNGRGSGVVKAVVSLVPSERPAAGLSTATPKTTRRFNVGFSTGGKPRVEFVQADVDAAVARFIAERGVTHAPAADPVDVTVTAVRRLGYVVVRDHEGFLLDGHIRIGTLDALNDFLSRRVDRRLVEGVAG